MNDFTKDEYRLGLSMKETIDMILRVHSGLHDIVMALQDRVLQLEMQFLQQDIFESGDNE
jgi:hypothetical protein